MTQEILLKTDQMVEFVRDGFLRFDEIVPDEINRAFLDHYVGDAMDERTARQGLPVVGAGTPLDRAYPEDSPLTEILRLPVVAGAIKSLVGPNPTFDHQALHFREPNQAVSQMLHSDAMIDARRQAFDIQLMYYPHDVDREMGGTLVVPGTHYRRANEAAIARYQNLKGQIQLVGKAGTVLILHHNIWHAGRQNRSDRPRSMFKIRIAPTVPQGGYWDMSDYDPAEARAGKPLYSPELNHEDIQGRLGRLMPWADCRGEHLDIVQRTKLWRLLSGDPKFSIHHWADRVENIPQ